MKQMWNERQPAAHVIERKIEKLGRKNINEQGLGGIEAQVWIIKCRKWYSWGILIKTLNSIWCFFRFCFIL